MGCGGKILYKHIPKIASYILLHSLLFPHAILTHRATPSLTYSSDSLFHLPVCSPVTDCFAEGDQYTSVPATPSMDAVCAPIRRCTQSEFEAVSPAPSSDRVCQALRTCTQDQFELNAPQRGDEQFVSDRVCRSLTQCTESEYIATHASPTTDRVCLPLTVCSPQEYQIRPASVDTDRTCTPLTVCAAGELQLRRPTATSDRACDVPGQVRAQVRLTALTPASFSDGRLRLLFQQAVTNLAARALPPAAPTPVPSNVTIISITPGSAVLAYVISVPASAAATVYAQLLDYDALLAALLALDPDTFASVVAGDIVCGPEQYAVTLNIGFGLKGCANATVCDDAPRLFEMDEGSGVGGGSGDGESESELSGQREYEAVPLSASADRVCAPVTSCTDDGEFEATEPTSTTDRVCRPLTVCSPSEYESERPSLSSDRVCMEITRCSAGEYAVSAPTETSDR